jgi:stearoyl-CoA desaturase (delta-9 desaturase)
MQWWISIPFLVVHLMPLGIIWTGITWTNVALGIGLYFMLMFFVTAGYHRYFSHRSYKTGRIMQFILAFGAQMSAQKGALWWAAHHRLHHKHSDEALDPHSPKRGFWWSHMGWIISESSHDTRFDKIKDFAAYPELRWLNKYHLLPTIALGSTVWLLGGVGALIVGFFPALILAYHGTFTVNSLAHVVGKRRYRTSDTSRNNLWIALWTLGEGWHNNHHHFQSSARQGFFWWEIDVTWTLLKGLRFVGLVHDLREPPAHLLTHNLISEFGERGQESGDAAGQGRGDFEMGDVAHPLGALDDGVAGEALLEEDEILLGQEPFSPSPEHHHGHAIGWPTEPDPAANSPTPGPAVSE